MNTYVICTYKKSLFFDYYYYVDVKEEYSSKIFLDNKIVVWKVRKLESKNTDYVIIECKTSKKNRDKFDECIKKLSDKMLLMGRRDYEEFAEQIMINLVGKNNYIVDCSGVSDKVYIVEVDADNLNHKEFMFMPASPNDVVDNDREVADRIKNLIDKNKLPYRKLTVKVKNVSTRESSIFNFINEDVK